MIHRILDAYLRPGSRQAALATLVKTRGSSYRKPGARLLIHEDGSTIGSISGGCVEQDILKKALPLMKGGKPELLVFDMMSPDDELWGYGQGCNGVLYVLIESLSSPEPQFDLITEVARRRAPGVIATVILVQGELKASVGSRVLLFPNGTVQETVLNPFVTSPIAEEAHASLTGTSHQKIFRFTEGSVEVFFEVVQPPLSLIIAGAGTDALPLCRLAKELGWLVTVIDHRPDSASRERFPDADSLVVREPDTLNGTIQPDSRSAVVIMTHNFRHDLILLPAFLNQPFPYVGLLGPRHRFDMLMKRLRENGMEFDTETLARLHTPVGLNIGAESPQEIALAIVAEIQAVMNTRM